MPTKYKRKPGSSRGSWSEETLKEAIKRIVKGEIGINEAARYYGIPSRTLRRRRYTGFLEKYSLGRPTTLGKENEKRLVAHIQRLEMAGFSPDRTAVRRLAYEFSERLGIKHSFNKNSEKAGYDWFNGFMVRNPELSLRQAEGLSLSRAEGMTREVVDNYFDKLKKIYNENDFYTKPGHVFNMDETGCHLTNDPGIVVATKGAKNVNSLTCAERGENISVIACINAEGVALPPALIFKGVRENSALSVGLPPGSQIYMNRKSSYISADIFCRWMKEHFFPRKPPGKVLLILDGHGSHESSIEMLEFALANDIILICLPSHTTHALQPLDRSVFKSFKAHYRHEAQNWVKHHPQTPLRRIHASALIGKAWTKAAVASSCINGFKITGIFPLNRNAVPEHFFQILQSSSDRAESRNITANDRTSITSDRDKEMVSTETSADNSDSTSKKRKLPHMSPLPGPSIEYECISEHSSSPSTHLHKISPVPLLEKREKSSKKKNLARVFDLSFLKEKKSKLENSNREGFGNKKTKTKKIETEKKITSSRRRIKKESESEIDVDEPESNNENKCLECLEDYFSTKSSVDWIKCIDCLGWLHETCTMYNQRCNGCGKIEKQKHVKNRK